MLLFGVLYHGETRMLNCFAFILADCFWALMVTVSECMKSSRIIFSTALQLQPRLFFPLPTPTSFLTTFKFPSDWRLNLSSASVVSHPHSVLLHGRPFARSFAIGNGELAPASRCPARVHAACDAASLDAQACSQSLSDTAKGIRSSDNTQQNKTQPTRCDLRAHPFLNLHLNRLGGGIRNKRSNVALLSLNQLGWWMTNKTSTVAF